MTAQEAYKYAKRAIQSEEAGTEARLIIETLAGRGSYFLQRELPKELETRLNEILYRRLTGEPLQYILGTWEFMGLEFAVSPVALIPRQDTETLAEAALALIRDRGYTTALDICTGTGCIGISIAKLAKIGVTIGDISDACVSLAQYNAKKNGVRVNTAVSDLFRGIEGAFDIITANPPYIAKSEMAALPIEVRHEPELALYGGEDGLDIYRRIAETYAEHLNPGGALLLEIGASQAGAVKEIFGGGRVLNDLNGLDRVVVIDEG